MRTTSDRLNTIDRKLRQCIWMSGMSLFGVLLLLMEAFAG
jgi:hypothetical protein